MGVPRLFPWFISAFPNAVRRFQQGEFFQKVDYLYLDANGLLHAAAQEVYNYGPNQKHLDPYRDLPDQIKQKKVFTLFFDNLRQITRIIIPLQVPVGE